MTYLNVAIPVADVARDCIVNNRAIIGWPSPLLSTYLTSIVPCTNWCGLRIIEIIGALCSNKNDNNVLAETRREDYMNRNYAEQIMWPGINLGESVCSYLIGVARNVGIKLVDSACMN